jgi:hypothetical protein
MISRAWIYTALYKKAYANRCTRLYKETPASIFSYAHLGGGGEEDWSFHARSAYVSRFRILPQPRTGFAKDPFAFIRLLRPKSDERKITSLLRQQSAPWNEANFAWRRSCIVLFLMMCTILWVSPKVNSPYNYLMLHLKRYLVLGAMEVWRQILLV